jgi:hypothetical protein
VARRATKRCQQGRPSPGQVVAVLMLVINALEAFAAVSDDHLGDRIGHL